MKSLKNIKALDVLPYHDMAKGKYKELGIVYPLEGVEPLSKEDAESLTEQCDILLEKMAARNEEKEYISDLKALREFVISQNDAQKKEEKRIETMTHFEEMTQSVHQMREPYVKPQIRQISGNKAKEILSLIEGNGR